MKDEKPSGQPLEVDNNQMRAIIEADALTTTQEVAKELNVNHSMVIQHLKQIERWKISTSGCLISWPKIKNTVVLKCHLFILCNNKEPFLDQIVTCNEKHILYNNHWQPAQWLDQKEVPKHFSKPNLHQKMVIVTLWWSAANLIHYSFLNASRIIPFEKYTQQISEMYWKLQCFQQNGPNSSPRQRPTAHHTTNASEIKRVELWSFALPAIFSWPHTNWSPLLQASRKLFAGKHFHNQ